MTCFICGDKFTESSMSGPAEPCHCGGCYRRGDFDGPDDPAFRRAMKLWGRGKSAQTGEADDQRISEEREA